MYKERKDKTPDKSAATAKKALNKIVRGFFRERKRRIFYMAVLSDIGLGFLIGNRLQE